MSHTVVCLSILVAWCGGARAEFPHEIRVLTYNIRHGEGMDHKVDLQRIAKVIVSARPDIVALEEVDQGVKRTNRIDEPHELARLTGMKAVFGRNITFQGGGYGTAVLTRLPVRSKKSIKLKSFYESTPEHEEQRGVQVIQLGNEHSPALLFLCTHLDYRPPDDERMNSAATINELFKKYGEEPAIIAGDFNARPDSRPIRAFAKEWKIAGWKDGAETEVDDGKMDSNEIVTFPADKPDHCIDYVMCRPASRWKVVEVRVINEPVASDHRPVLAVLRRIEEFYRMRVAHELHCEEMSGCRGFFAGINAMVRDFLPHGLRPMLIVPLFFLLLQPAARGVSQELKEFDSDYLQPPAGGPALNEAEQQIVRLTNEFRKEHGRAELKPDKRLQKSAAYFAAYMARTDKYGHEADGNEPAERMSLMGYDYCIAAENIAYQMKSTGFKTEELAKDVFEGWKNSPPHRANMLDPDLEEMGVAIGYAPGSDRYYAVQDFGRPKSAAIHFEVANHTADTLHYTVRTSSRGKPKKRVIVLPPRTVMFHTRCRPATIDWDWTQKDDAVRAENRQKLVITKSAGGYDVARQPANE
ncbi:MAG TPA: endonuclease/exonuclease/phosphatase family protein [Lacipirellulaceae bacterium]|nr:endonuclease/exonuclease/phosphatase family protein [Lacipirellulaceae bacterium]